MSNMFVGFDGVSHKVKKMLIGVDGVAHNVKAAYIGVDGKARCFFGGYYTPNVNEVIVNLSSRGEYFNLDTMFAPGVYQIDIFESHQTSTVNASGFSVQTTMTDAFKIFGFVSNTMTNSAWATFANNLGVDSGTSIFGGRGGLSSGYSRDSADTIRSGVLAVGGACCHFLPKNRTFGTTDYYRCFHCGAQGDASCGGSGAYGGGAGGRGARTASAHLIPSIAQTGATGNNGKGTGGAGGTDTTNGQPGSGLSGNPGSSGTGVGAGTALQGGIAWYNGSSWVTPTRLNQTVSSFLKVTYLGQN